MPTKALLLALVLAPLTVAGPAIAQDQPELDARVEEQLGLKLPLPDRPVLAEGRLVWADYQLAELCSEFGGEFAKLPGKAIYLCRHEVFDRMSTASIGAE